MPVAAPWRPRTPGVSLKALVFEMSRTAAIQLLAVACDSPCVPESTDGPEGFFRCRAEDPSGTRYVISVVPVYGVAGPVFLAVGESLRQGPVLRRVNGLLRRLQPPARRTEHAMVTVAKAVPREDQVEVLYTTDVASLGKGREVALAIAEEISTGTFDATTKRH